MVVPKRKVFVIGVGMTPFQKPKEDTDYPELAKEALIKALDDAGISINQVQQACCGYVYGDSTCGQRALYQIGMTGIPVFNVNNNCSTGSSALMLAKQFIESGSDCTLALGFEKMEKGSLGAKLSLLNVLEVSVAISKPTISTAFASNPYLLTKSSLARTAAAAPSDVGQHCSLVRGPNILGEFMICSKVYSTWNWEFLEKLDKCFLISSLQIGFDMTKAAADRLYEKTQIKPSDIDVIELHDCFSANELITYEALGLCPVGKAKDFIDSGANTYGGKHVVNPSGGLISKGHPLGATGLAQCAELCWQLRGEAGKRQVPNARLALQHNLGLGGACIVALYRLGFPTAHRPKAAQAQIANHPVAASNIAEDPSIFKCHNMFKLLESAMNDDDDNLVEGFRGVYAFEVRNGPGGKSGRWIINTSTGKGKITYNGTDKPEVTFIVNDVDIIDLISGKLDPQKAFFQNKLKIQGNMGLAMKLTKLQKQAGPKIEVLRSKL
ncbi:non-specific lipid-transfer protein-like [Diaphorina citri]|uniref:Sterol carrier protein 2 n=1 Tax=Diaphorina citri TaxID=121845 RepID=A0A3Q0IQ07_DIACI|nr:non-specific lipid-transfer protein-like [Diaphorina citri]